MSEWRPAGYWSEVETASEPLLDLLADAAGEDWDLRGAIVTGESDDGETLFTLVLRHRVGDAGLVVRLGFATVSLDRPEDPVSWTDNFLDMRVQGSLPAALTLLFNEQSMGDTRDPLALDARPTSPEEDAEVLTAPWREVSTVREEDATAPETASTSSTQSSTKTEEPDVVRCEKCGAEVDVEEAESFGGFGDSEAWVHSGRCPE